MERKPRLVDIARYIVTAEDLGRLLPTFSTIHSSQAYYTLKNKGNVSSPRLLLPLPPRCSPCLPSVDLLIVHLVELLPEPPHLPEW